MTTEKQTRALTGHYAPYLRAWREHFGYGVIEVSKASGIDRGNMSKYERCVMRPTTKILDRIAAVYGISHDTLLYVDPATVTGRQDELRERALRDLARRAEQQEQILATYAAQSA